MERELEREIYSHDENQTAAQSPWVGKKRS